MADEKNLIPPEVVSSTTLNKKTQTNLTKYLSQKEKLFKVKQDKKKLETKEKELEASLQETFETLKATKQKDVVVDVEGVRLKVRLAPGGLNTINKQYVTQFLTRKLLEEQMVLNVDSVTSLVTDMFSAKYRGHKEGKLKVVVDE